MKPVRVQLSRKRGWRFPPNTVKVDRTTSWGNSFTPTMVLVSRSRGDLKQGEPIGVAGAVEAYRTLLQTCLRQEPERYLARLEQLRGKNLACWCALDAPCHADVLLEFANRSPRRKRAA